MVYQKQDTDGNQVGRSILDTCLYEVEFPGGEITELAANMIAESMYAQCDVNRNLYLLLEVFVNHRKKWFSSQCRGPELCFQRVRNS